MNTYHVYIFYQLKKAMGVEFCFDFFDYYLQFVKLVCMMLFMLQADKINFDELDAAF